MEIEIGETKIPVRHCRTETNHYYLKVSFETEETIDTDKHRVIRDSFFSLLEDVDPDSVDGLSKSLTKKIREGGNLSPNSRQDVTNSLIEEAFWRLIDKVDDDILKIDNIKVYEKTDIREIEFKKGGYELENPV